VFSLKPDFEEVMDRYEAWWDRAVLDRPLVSIPFATPDPNWPMPVSEHASLRDRWMDADYNADAEAAVMHRTTWYADALPVCCPNLGPEVFSAFYGCELTFGKGTSWTSPVLPDWSPESVAALQLDEVNVYFRKMEELYDAYLERGDRHFIVGYTDLHGGGDAIAAFRDPQVLLMDTLEHGDAIKALNDRITTDFLKLYDRYHARLSAAGMPSSAWTPATCRGKFHIPANDLSCMISDAMFEDLFIPGIVRECQHMDRCLYHLDGPQALRYLDRLLEIPEIDAIQWVPGAGQEHWAQWIEVYQRIQSRGKALQILNVPVEDLPLLFSSLAPEGVWVSNVEGVRNSEDAASVLNAFKTWTAKQ